MSRQANKHNQCQDLIKTKSELVAHEDGEEIIHIIIPKKSLEDFENNRSNF